MKKIIFFLLIMLSGAIFLGYGSVYYILKPINNNTDAEMVEIIASDGIKLFAVENKSSIDSHKWALLIHSYRSSHSLMNGFATEYQKRDYNTIQPDNRGHGKSGGKWIGMGYLDQFDILCWIQYILDKDPDAEIVLHGVSMGASALLMLSGQEGLPKNIKVIIADSGYTSATDYLTWKLKQRYHLPAFPIIPVSNIAFKTVAGYYMDDASALEGVKNSKIPTLFIHGMNDLTVPLSEATRLYEAAKCPKELFVVRNAGHGEAVIVEPGEYWAHVWRFVDNNQ